MIPDSQDGPVYPGAQLQVLGLTQVPPFLQPLLHTAIRVTPGTKRKEIVKNRYGFWNWNFQVS